MTEFSTQKKTSFLRKLLTHSSKRVQARETTVIKMFDKATHSDKDVCDNSVYNMIMTHKYCDLEKYLTSS